MTLSSGVLEAAQPSCGEHRGSAGGDWRVWQLRSRVNPRSAGDPRSRRTGSKQRRGGECILEVAEDVAHLRMTVTELTQVGSFLMNGPSNGQSAPTTKASAPHCAASRTAASSSAAGASSLRHRTCPAPCTAFSSARRTPMRASARSTRQRRLPRPASSPSSPAPIWRPTAFCRCGRSGSSARATAARWRSRRAMRWRAARCAMWASRWSR